MFAPATQLNDIDQSVTASPINSGPKSTPSDTPLAHRSGPETSSVRVKNADDPEKKDRAAISIDALYGRPDAVSPILSSALRLLAEGVEHIEAAINFADEGSRIASDNEVMRIQALLPELFCCRSLGDGFGLVISSVHQSLKNQQGEMLDAVQLRAIARL